MPHTITQPKIKSPIGVFRDLMQKVIQKGSTTSSLAFDFNALDEGDMNALQELLNTGFTLKSAFIALSRMPDLIEG